MDEDEITAFVPFYSIRDINLDTRISDVLRKLEDSRQDHMIDISRIPSPFDNMMCRRLVYLGEEVYGLTSRDYLDISDPEERIADLVEKGHIVLGKPGHQEH